MNFRKSAITTALLLATGVANAALTTIEVTAQVSDVYDPGMVLGNAITPGSLITGSYVYETTTPDSDSSADTGHYEHGPGPYGFNLNVEGLNFQSVNGMPFHLHVMNSYFDDAYHVHSNNLAPLPSGAVVDFAHIGLSGAGTTAFSSDLLPTAAPDLLPFPMRDLFIGGRSADGNANYNIAATVTALSGGTTPTPTGATGYRLAARVAWLDDPGNLLGGSVQVGNMADGTLYLRTDVPDQDGNSEWGRYSQPLTGGLGFDLNLGGHRFRSNSSAGQPVELHVGNSAYSDNIHIMSFNHSPLANGAQVNHMAIDLYDGEHNALTSDALNASILLKPEFEQRRLFISGSMPGGMSSYNMELEITSLQTAERFKISPADGSFDRMQHFDLGVLFATGVTPPQALSVRVNGNDLGSPCNPGAPNLQQRFTLVCPGVSNLLQPGNNQVVVETVIDGRQESATANYELLGM